MSLRRLPGLLACCALWPVAARAQSVSPADAKDSARFAAVMRSVATSGYTQARIVAHGVDDADWLFVLNAMRGDSGVLIATVAPVGVSPGQPEVVTMLRRPAPHMMKAIRPTVFLSVPELFDIAIDYETAADDSVRSYTQHHIVRRRYASLELVCSFPGNRISVRRTPAARITTTELTTVVRVAGTGTTFERRANIVSVERQTADTTIVTSVSTERVERFRISPSGTCIRS